MATKYSIPIVGEPNQALLKIQNRLAGAIAPQRVELEFVRDDAGNLIELIVCFADDLSPEQVRGAINAIVEVAERDGIFVATSAPGSGGVVFSKVDGFEAQTVGLAPVGFVSSADAGTVTVVAADPHAGANSVNLDSGAATGTNALGCSLSRAVGSEVSVLDWTFWVKFPTLFTTNNNAVTGIQVLTLDLRLNDVVAPLQDVIFRYTFNADVALGSPATDTGAPVHAGQAIPTGPPPPPATAIPIDGAYHKVRIRKLAGYVLGLQIDSNAEATFEFYNDIVVPSLVQVSHNWSAPLDRAFNVDDWALNYEVVAPAS